MYIQEGIIEALEKAYPKGFILHVRTHDNRIATSIKPGDLKEADRTAWGQLIVDNNHSLRYIEIVEELRELREMVGDDRDEEPI